MSYKYTVEAKTDVAEPSWIIRVVDDKGDSLHSGEIPIKGSTILIVEKAAKSICLEYDLILSNKLKAEIESKNNQENLKILTNEILKSFKDGRIVTDEEIKALK